MKVNINKIILARARKGLTIFELSKISGVNRNTISRIEKNIVSPNYSTVGKISNALEIKLEELLEDV